MLTIPSIKSQLSTLLADQLGVWTLDDGTTQSSIYSGQPPDGARMTSPGVQCIILDNAKMSVMPFLGGVQSQGNFSHTVDLELWLPKDVEPPQIHTLPAVFALCGVEDAPVQRIMHDPYFLNLGVPLNPVNAPRTDTRKAHSIIYLNSYCIHG